MAMTPTSDNECSIPMPVVEATAHADAGGSGEVQQRESVEEEQTESCAAMARRKLDRLNMIVFCVAFLEWAGNTVGTVAFIWATVVLLGGFCSLLSRMDFWFSAIMIFMEGSSYAQNRVFIRNDASVNQWLFGSTTAFRWENLSPHGLLALRSTTRLAIMTGVGISFTPIEARPKIVAGVLKLALLVTFSQLQTRSKYAKFFRLLVASAVLCGGIVGALKLGIRYIKRSKANHIVSFLKIGGMSLGWLVRIELIVLLPDFLLLHTRIFRFTMNPVTQLCNKVILASGLACLPFLQALLPSYYRYLSIPIAIVMFSFGMAMQRPSLNEKISSIRDLLLHILDTILPILFIWSVMYPLPGISLELSFYMLFSVIAGVLIANLQIPVAFLQVLLSAMRLHSLLDHHHHDYHPLPQDASPNLVPSIVVFFVMELCQGSSYILATILGLISLFCRIWLVRDLKFEDWGAKAVNLYHQQAYQARTVKGLLASEKSTPSLPSFAIECLGSTSSETQLIGLRILGTFLQQWDPKSKTELIAEITSTSKKAVPTLIHMLGSTGAREKDIRLFAASVIAELIGTMKISNFPGMVKLISSLLDAKNQQDSLPPTDSLTISEFRRVVKLIPSLLDPENQQYDRSQSIYSAYESTLLWRMFPPLLGMSVLHKLAGDTDNCTEMVEEATYITTKTVGLISYLTSGEISGDPKKKISLRLSLNFVRWLASNSWKNGARFRQELSEKPILLNSLEHILYFEDCQPELWKPVMDIIAKLALDEAARQEIGSTKSIIPKLMHTFLMPKENNNCSMREENEIGHSVREENNYDPSLRKAAGEALANLTIMSTDNCWAILSAKTEHNLVMNLVKKLEDDYFICVAANLLHNLCANSRDKLMDNDFGANVHLESALSKVMQIIMTKEGKELEAALGAASQIGYLIPEDFAQNLQSYTDATAEELVEKLVNTLKDEDPCPEYPRIRRVLIEVIISIVGQCPRYIKFFVEKKAKEALDKVKGTPSRWEKYRIFLGGEGVVAESLPMRDLVDKAKRLIDPAFSTPGA